MNKYDKMLASNRKASEEKIELAKKTILEMVQEDDKVTVPKLIEKTGLSRGFFYKNLLVRELVEKAMKQQSNLVDSRRVILNQAMDSELERVLRENRKLKQEIEMLSEENEKLKKALSRKNANLLRNL